jgi:hypothetical protein
MSQAGKDAAKHFYRPMEVVEEVKEATPDRSGVCFNCGHGSWTMKTKKGVFYRKCKACGADQPEIT